MDDGAAVINTLPATPLCCVGLYIIGYCRSWEIRYPGDGGVSPDRICAQIVAKFSFPHRQLLVFVFLSFVHGIFPPLLLVLFEFVDLFGAIRQSFHVSEL